nr:LIM domain-containing protein A-like [Penaeus vannamei]
MPSHPKPQLTHSQASLHLHISKPHSSATSKHHSPHQDTLNHSKHTSPAHPSSHHPLYDAPQLHLAPNAQLIPISKHTHPHQMHTHPTGHNTTYPTQALLDPLLRFTLTHSKQQLTQTLSNTSPTLMRTHLWSTESPSTRVTHLLSTLHSTAQAPTHPTSKAHSPTTHPLLRPPLTQPAQLHSHKPSTYSPTSNSQHSPTPRPTADHSAPLSRTFRLTPKDTTSPRTLSTQFTPNCWKTTHPPTPAPLTATHHPQHHFTHTSGTLPPHPQRHTSHHLHPTHTHTHSKHTHPHQAHSPTLSNSTPTPKHSTSFPPFGGYSHNFTASSNANTPLPHPPKHHSPNPRA